MLYLSLTRGNAVWIVIFVIVTLVVVGLLLINVPRLAREKAYY
jgi:ABC-type transporter Mla subunit MlaD